VETPRQRTTESGIIDQFSARGFGFDRRLVQRPELAAPGLSSLGHLNLSTLDEHVEILNLRLRVALGLAFRVDGSPGGGGGFRNSAFTVASVTGSLAPKFLRTKRTQRPPQKVWLTS
jgi:hypothetical protein